MEMTRCGRRGSILPCPGTHPSAKDSALPEVGTQHLLVGQAASCLGETCLQEAGASLEGLARNLHEQRERRGQRTAHYRSPFKGSPWPALLFSLDSGVSFRKT